MECLLSSLGHPRDVSKVKYNVQEETNQTVAAGVVNQVTKKLFE